MLLWLAACAATEPVRSCNGLPALCDVAVDAVTFPGTHNSAAAEEDGFVRGVNANQSVGVAAQLDLGVRALLLDVYEEDGARVLCHGPCALGSVPHLDVLAAIDAFLSRRPAEVVWIVYEDSVDPSSIADDFATIGLDGRVYAHDGGAWPTLGALVDADTRLIVTLERGGPPPEWLHHVWDLVWDTPYAWTSLDAMDCSLNRGDPANPILQVNHWLSTGVGLPDPDAAAEANDAAALRARVDGCVAAVGRGPNLLVVDYFEVGDVIAVAAERNGS